MNESFTGRHRNGAGALTHQPQGSRIVRLCVAFSGRYPHAGVDVHARLGLLLRPAGVSAVATDRHLTLIRARHVLAAADWCAVIGWLMRQPEVVFVAREYPVTGSNHAAR